jgi:hypothetical protein
MPFGLFIKSKHYFFFKKSNFGKILEKIAKFDESKTHLTNSKNAFLTNSQIGNQNLNEIGLID